VVEPGGAEGDQRLARPGLGVCDILVAEDVRSTVFVNPNGFHEA
jgi:hypothetical protein